MSEETTLLRRGDPHYSSLLAEIHDPPEKLYVRGELPDGLYLAVVGARLPTPYGKQVTPKIVEPLAATGVVIVSGLAYGIDALAHEAALGAGGKTVAVLGTGVDEASLYPRQHRKLARRIIEKGGAIISEYPSGTGPQKYHFPARNRIIAGMSKGVVLIEAKEKSGALITADFAVKENRDVFAVPGPITSSLSVGPNQLIQQGAKALLSANDVLSEYDLLPKERNAHITTSLSSLEQRLLDTLADTTLHVDALGNMLNLPAAELSSLLMTLELKGMIRNLGGGLYGRT